MYICIMGKQILNRIKAVLAEKDINQIRLSNELKKGRVTVNRYCNNETQPSLETLKRISEILDVSMCDLLVDN